MDPQLQENLESFFRLEYPRFELLFSVADADDPARPLVERLMAKYPRVRSRLFIGVVPVGPNPKISNLVKSYDGARYDWILISDSNIRAEPTYLKCLASEFTEDVGVLTAVVKGERASSFGGRLEAAFLNSFFARWMILAPQFGRPVVIGKSMMFRRSQAARFGGIAVLGRYLAEDYMAGEAMRMLGLRVAVLSAPVSQPLGGYSLREFWSRHLRWGRIRKNQAFFAFAFEPWTGAVASGIAGAWFFSHELAVPFLWFFAAHLMLWGLCDLCLLRRLGGVVDSSAIGAWLVRECLAIPMWFHAMIGNTVCWRGQQLRLLKGGILEGRSSL